MVDGPEVLDLLPALTAAPVDPQFCQLLRCICVNIPVSCTHAKVIDLALLKLHVDQNFSVFFWPVISAQCGGHLLRFSTSYTSLCLQLCSPHGKAGLKTEQLYLNHKVASCSWELSGKLGERRAGTYRPRGFRIVLADSLNMSCTTQASATSSLQIE